MLNLSCAAGAYITPVGFPHQTAGGRPSWKSIGTAPLAAAGSPDRREKPGAADRTAAGDARERFWTSKFYALDAQLEAAAENAPPSVVLDDDAVSMTVSERAFAENSDRTADGTHTPPPGMIEVPEVVGDRDLVDEVKLLALYKPEVFDDAGSKHSKLYHALQRGSSARLARSQTSFAPSTQSAAYKPAHKHGPQLSATSTAANRQSRRGGGRGGRKARGRGPQVSKSAAQVGIHRA